MIGGFTWRLPYDCTQPCSVKANPSSCSPKYSTMSLRSNSPWTSTSSPSSSWSFNVRVICSAMKASYSGPVSLPSCSCLRAARTSAVWGNDPMVVEWARRRGEIGLRDLAPVDPAGREDFAFPPPARRPRLEQRCQPCPGTHRIHVQPGHWQIQRRRQVVVQRAEIRRDQELHLGRLVGEEAIRPRERLALGRGAVESEARLGRAGPGGGRRRQARAHPGA